MRLALHFAAWWVIFSVVTLALAKWQIDHWCSLPDWLGPGIHYPEACHPRTIVVRPIGD